MKSQFTRKLLLFVLLSGLVVLGIFSAVPNPASAQGMSGANLENASKTASGFNERRIEYNWSVTKTADQSSITIRDGECATVQYTLQVTRTLFSDVVVAGVRGQICVTNNGSVATQGLRIVDEVQIKTGPGPFEDFATQEVDVSSNPVLDPGETGCYNYEVIFTPVAGAQYKNTARITITNHSGHLGEPFGPSPSSGAFTIPDTPTTVEEDASAMVTDVLSSTCADGIVATPTPPGTPTSFSFSASDLTFPPTDPTTGSATRSYNVSVCNDGVACGSTCTLTNTATLTESGPKTQETRTSLANVSVSTGDCGPGTGNEGCSLGFFKNHPGAFPSPYTTQTTLGSAFPCLSTTTLSEVTLQEALGFTGGSGVEGATRILLRQAVAALLNAASPDVNYPLTVTQVVTQVCAAIATNDRQLILELATQLDEFNNLGCPLD